MIYRGRSAPMDIRKARDNFDKDKKLKCFNYNTYRHMVTKYRKPKKEKETRKCYKYNKVGYLAKDCRSKQKMKIRRNQEELDELDKEEDNKKKGFVKGSE